MALLTPSAARDRGGHLSSLPGEYGHAEL